jgi:5-methyltetrahydrofolate--homocysteine methyltransferase
MEKKTFFEILNQGILLFDGGMGTQVQAMGLKTGEAPEAWNLEHPDRIGIIHDRYIAAGARVVTTNSFGGSRYKLEKAGLGDTAAQINLQAAAIARSAAGDSGVLVAGCVGPTGEFVHPLGTIRPEEMEEQFKRQAKALLDGGADLIIVETMTALDEACLAVKAARSLGDFPVIATMTFDNTKVGYRTMMGVDIPTGVQGLLDGGADVVGSNCGNGIDDFISIVREIRTVTDRPVLAQANAGLPELVDRKTVYHESAEEMAGKLPGLLDAGAALVGGCCGTTPETIRLFADVIALRQGK